MDNFRLGSWSDCNFSKRMQVRMPTLFRPFIMASELEWHGNTDVSSSDIIKITL